MATIYDVADWFLSIDLLESVWLTYGDMKTFYREIYQQNQKV